MKTTSQYTNPQTNVRRTASVLVGVLLVMTSLAITGCDYLHDTTEQRRELADSPDHPITLGVAWPFSEMDTHLREGVQLAIDELNERGGINNRTVKAIFKNDERDVTKGRLVAQQFADNPEIFAVIGHYNSYVSIPASTIYQLNGILMLTPGSTSPDLTSSEYDLIFRSIPSDNLNAKRIADIVHKQDHRQISLLYEQSSYGRGLANSFQQHAQSLNIPIKDRTSYTSGELDVTFFGHLIQRWERQGIDAVVFAGATTEASALLRHAHQGNCDFSLYTGDAVDLHELWDRIGEAADGTLTMTPFHPKIDAPEARTFVNRFKDRFGHPPDAWAAQGYDAVHLLAHGMDHSGTSVSGQVAEQLRTMDSYSGVTGSYAFDETGDLVGNPMEFIRLKDGELHPLSPSNSESSRNNSQ